MTEPINKKVAAALPRLFSIAWLCVMTLGISSCMMPQIKESIPDIPQDAAAYFDVFADFDSMPDWVSLYSVLPGHAHAHCNTRIKYAHAQDNRKLEIIPCGSTVNVDLQKLSSIISQTLDRIEDRFDSKIHVSRAKFTLVPIGMRYSLRSTQILFKKHLKFEIALRVRPSDIWLTGAVRSTAHELYHLAMAATDQRRLFSDSASYPEEVRASLFASCIEYDVYGFIHPFVLDKNGQFNPDDVSDHRVIHDSAKGNLAATRILRNVYGTRSTPSSLEQTHSFAQLCNDLVQ